MSRYLILAQSEVTANALSAWPGLLREKPLNSSDDPRRIVWDRPQNREGAVDAYHTLVRCVELAASGEDDRVPLNQIVALVDAVHPSELSTVEEGGSWDNLVAMLILTFPEIRWVFGVCAGTAKLSPVPDVPEEPKTSPRQTWKTIEEAHSLTSLLGNTRCDPLLDPTGLREWVRARTVEMLKAADDDLELPSRQKTAAAIDEERLYAYLHAYTAYRFGCRADVVTTWELMEERFSPEANCNPNDQEGSEANESHGYWLLLEDMSLNFPDRPGRRHLLRLDQRADQFHKLNSTNEKFEPSEYRILVTTGQSRPGDNVISENRNYLRNKAVGRGKIVFKPASGMFDLWRKAGLVKKTGGRQRAGNAPGFVWPPERPKSVGEAMGHGAPGKLMLIADTLITRAETLIDNVKNIDAAVQGAVLVTDALELTGGRTPTTAFEALSLKHRFELLAECQFSGVEYHIDIAPRLAEIELETLAIARWFHRAQRTKAKLNAKMMILGELVRILRNYSQFDEEQICMAEVRRLNNRLWMRQKPFRYAFFPVLWYLEVLLSSFPVFLTVMFVWICALALLFWWTGYSETSESFGLWSGLSDSVSSFFSMGDPIPTPITPSDVTEMSFPWGYVAVSCIAIVSGALHLGVFISHLYSIVARR